MANEFLDYQGLDYFKYKLIEGLSDSIDAVPSSRTVNGKALSSDISLTSTDIGAVPTSRTVNGKALSSDIVLSASDVGALSSTGTAAAATKLATSRTIQTNLSSTSSASFNGTASVTPGVTGTLPIANGGTGGTTASKAVYNLTQPLTARTKANLSSYASTTYIPLYYGSSGYKTALSELLSDNIEFGSYIGNGSTSALTLSFSSSFNWIIIYTTYTSINRTVVIGIVNNLSGNVPVVSLSNGQYSNAYITYLSNKTSNSVTITMPESSGTPITHYLQITNCTYYYVKF